MFPVPSHTPLHFTFVVVNVVANGAGCKTVATAVAVHPFVSLTVTVYTPAGNVFAVLLFPADEAAPDHV